jgi:cobalt-zinc-cadmium efflux system membrane fusion protein
MAGALALAALAVGASFLHPEPRPPDAKPKMSADAQGVTLPSGAPQWKYVELAVAAEKPPLAPLPAPARIGLDEKRTASVGAPLQGRIDSVSVHPGDEVKAGDPLFSVRSAAFADLDREAESARQQVAVRRRVADRARDLLELKAIPERDALAAQAELTEAELALKAAEAKRRSLAVSSDGAERFVVRAPRAGTVVDLEAVAGQEVGPDRDRPLVRISDLSEVIVLADVREADAADLKPGAHATIHTRGGAERDGEVERVSALLDPQRQTVEVRLRAANADRALRPNAFAEVLFDADAGARRVQVPEEAVVSDGDTSLMFVSRGQGRLEKVKVEPGRRREGQVELRAGLTPGEAYVSRGALLLLNQVDLSAD